MIFSNFQKIEKKVVRRFLTYLKFLNIFEFLTKSVLQTLVRGRVTIGKKYQEIIEKSAKNMIFSNFLKIEKKVVRRFLTYLKFLNFFEFFTKSVLQTLVRGRVTIGKKYQEIFEKSAKNMFFRLTHYPSPVTRQPSPVTRHPSPVKIKKSTKQKTSILEAVFESQKTFSSRDIKEKENQMGPLGGPPKGVPTSGG